VQGARLLSVILGLSLHADVQLATDPPNKWTLWTPNVTNRCWSTGATSQCSGAKATITVNNVPAGATVWVTAHLDSVGNAGANDDASGLVSILMTARALERLDLEHTVHFVAYDLEEVGLIGSSRYAGSVVRSIHEQEGERAIIGNINCDMIGYEPGRFDAVIGNPPYEDHPE
jgi:Zn-dependent M28 family amino/carboxypeptidase